MLAFAIDERWFAVIYIAGFLFVAGLVLLAFLRVGKFLGKGMSRIEKKWDEEDARKG